MDTICSSHPDTYAGAYDYVRNVTGISTYCWNIRTEEEYQCMAKFSGDADVAGYGVMTSFLVYGGVTLAFALLSTCRNPSFLWRAFQCWYRAEDWDKLLQMFPKPVDSFERRMLKPLCDIQILTGVAVVVSGCAEMKNLSFYHGELVRQYWYLTLNSLWAALVFSRGVPAQTSLLRQISILISLVTFAIFGGMTWYREYHDWNYLEAGKCYRYRTGVPYWSEWMWIAGVILMAIVLFTEICSESAFKRIEKIWKEVWLTEQELIRMIRQECRSIYGKMSRSTRQHTVPFLDVLMHMARIVLNSGLLTALFAIRQFLALWAIGDDTVVAVLVYCAFYIWALVEIICMKILNTDSLIESQDEAWGFGQMMQLALLGAIIYMGRDAFFGAHQ